MLAAARLVVGGFLFALAAIWSGAWIRRRAQLLAGAWGATGALGERYELRTRPLSRAETAAARAAERAIARHAWDG